MEEVERTILEITPINPKGKLEKEYETYYREITNSTKNFSSSQLQEYLYQTVMKGSKEHDEVALGLLYSILTHPGSCSTILQTLTIITKDFLGSFVNAAIHLVYEYYARLSDVSKEQIFWLLNELLNNNVTNAGHLLIALLRCISVGSFSKTNVWSMKQMFYVLNKHRQYLLSNPTILQPVIFCYMNFLLSQFQVPEMASFVDEEIEFLLAMINSNISESMRIGKEFARVLFDLSKYRAFEELWNKIKNDPKLFNTTTNTQSPIIQMLNIGTSRRILTTQIPYNIEKKLIFITSQVRQRQQHFYSEWLIIQHFEDRESVELVPSLIRYICCVIHPPNDIITSDIVQRWALVGQLLFIAKDNQRVSDCARFALFYDWLFFDHQTNPIMHLEPAILLIYNSFESHPLVSLSLIEFICIASGEYLPEFRELLKANVNKALETVLVMKAIPSLSPLLDFLAKHPKVSSLFEKTFSTVIAQYGPKSGIHQKANEYEVNLPPPKRSAEKRSINSDNNIPYKAAILHQDTPSVITTSPDSRIVPNTENSNKNDVFTLAKNNNNESNTISGYTYALSHNHIPQLGCDLDSLNEFNRIENETIRKNFIYIRSSGVFSAEIEAVIDNVFKYAKELEPNGDPLRDLSCCFAYSRADDLSVSLTFSDLSILFHVFNCYVTNTDTQLGKCLDFFFTQWHYIDCRFNYAFMYFLATKKHSLKLYFDLVKSNEKTIKNDIKTCYDHDLYALENILIFMLIDMPKLILNDTGMCEYLIKVMDPNNCSNILTILTKHQFNSGLRLDNSTMVFLLKNSTHWDIFTEEMFFLLLRSFRFQFEVEFLSQYLEDIDHAISHHLLHHLANGTPNLKLFSSSLMKNFNESYKFIVTQWLLRFPSMMIAVVCQWLLNNSHQLQSICSLFCYLFEHNENDSIKAKLKGDQSFTKILQFVSTKYTNLTDEKLRERTKVALEMIDKAPETNGRKKKAHTPTSGGGDGPTTST